MGPEESNPPSHESIRAAARELVDLAWSYVLPVRIARIEDNKEVGYNTGTGILLRVGRKYVVGTAWHVFEEYGTRKSRGEEVYVLVGDVPLEPPSVSFADRSNDLVFLAVPESRLSDLEAVPYEPGLRWPPRRVNTDDDVFLCGLPAYLRTEEGDSEIVFGNLSLIQPVTSASENHFVLQLDRDQWLDLGRERLPGEDVFLGGLSGAPVFAVDPLSFPLVGLVSEIGESLPLLYVKSLAHLPREF